MLPSAICAPLSQLPAARPTSVTAARMKGSATSPTKEYPLKRPPLHLVVSNSQTPTPLPSAATAPKACVDGPPYVSQPGPGVFVASQPGRGSLRALLSAYSFASASTVSVITGASCE